MNERQDYWDPKDLAVKLACERDLFEDIAEPYDSVWEPFAGVGHTHGILASLGLVTPVTNYRAMELSERCVQRYNARWPGTCVQGDVFRDAWPEELPGRSLVLLLQNTFSPLRTRTARKHLLLGQTFALQPTNVVILDTAIFRLHLNIASYSLFYGEPVIDFESYVLATDAWYQRQYGYRIAKVSCYSGAARMLLEGVDDVRSAESRSIRIFSTSRTRIEQDSGSGGRQGTTLHIPRYCSDAERSS